MSHLARLVAALALCVASFSAAETAAFGPGEQVVYRASFLGIPAGTIQVTVGAEFPDTPGVWPIVLLGRSDVGLFFFPIRDKMVVRWDAEHAQTLGMEMWADENHKRRHLKIVFDHAEGKARLFRQVEGQDAVQEEIAVKPDAADVASALYLLRTRRLEPGTELALPVVTPSKQFPLRAVVEARETLKTPLGPQATVRVRLTTDFSGKLKARSDLVIYFTDDEAHVPVRIEADLALGTVVVEAVEHHSGMRTRVRPPARTEAR
jgi:Protein of unknown function (DUF3108)